MRRSRLAGLLGAVLAPFGMAPGCDTSIRPVTGGGSSTSAPEPLLVSGVEPPPGRVEVGPLRSFRVRFSEPLDPASVGPEALTIRDAGSGNRIPGTFILDEGGTALIFQPSAFSPGAPYCLSLSGGIRGVSGSELDPDSQPSGCAASYSTFASPPVLQGAVSAEVRSSSSVSLAWEPARDEGADPNDIVYEVYRSGSPEPIDFSAPAKVSPPGATGELLTGLEPDTEYFIALRARDPAGNRSDPSPAANVKTPANVDTSPPVFGGIVSLSTLSPTSLQAAWEAARDDQDPPAILRYNAYVALAPAAQDFGVIAKTSEPGAVEMMLDGLAPDTTYHVVVRAVDTAANEDRNTAETSATTPVSYSLNVAPILTRINLGGCSRTSCHSGPAPDGGLDLSSHRGLLAGGQNRAPPAVVPGNGKGSYILWRTDASNPNYRRDLPRMPSGGRALSDAQLRTIEHWIDQGALDN